MVKIAINGFGRIGRNAFKNLAESFSVRFGEITGDLGYLAGQIVKSHCIPPYMISMLNYN